MTPFTKADGALGESTTSIVTLPRSSLDHAPNTDDTTSRRPTPLSGLTIVV
jgi:hypothetical protein